MKKQPLEWIEEHQNEIVSFGTKLFEYPELGFKEFETRKLLIEELAKSGIEVETEYFETGFSVSLKHGEGLCIGLIAEMDALVTKDHPSANPETGAAHTCGHSIQGAVMTSVLRCFKECTDENDWQGTLRLFFTPAEEFVDVPYREQLVKEGKLKYLSGKQNMLAVDLFDGCDCVISCHTMGESPYAFCIHSTLAGFVYKRITFEGTAAHAAILPQLGHNALNMFTLFQSAVGMLRETFVDEDKVRIHGMIDKGGDSVNAIPSEVVYECYVRSVNQKTLQKVSEQVSHIAECCCDALEGTCKIEDVPGYLPLIPSHTIGDVFLPHMKEYADDSEILTTEVSMAAGDVGDVSQFYPTIQFGFSGASGRVHGNSFEITDNDRSYIEPCKILAESILDLFKNQVEIKRYCDSYQRMSKEEYLRYLNPTK